MRYNRRETVKLWNQAQNFRDILNLHRMFLRGDLCGTPDWPRRLFADTKPFVPYLIELLEFGVISILGQGYIEPRISKVRKVYTTVNIPKEFRKGDAFCQVRQRQHLGILMPKKLIEPFISRAKHLHVVWRNAPDKVAVSQARCDVVKSNVETRKWRTVTKMGGLDDFGYFDPGENYKPGAKLFPMMKREYEVIHVIDLNWGIPSTNLAREILNIIVRI